MRGFLNSDIMKTSLPTGTWLFVKVPEKCTDITVCKDKDNRHEYYLQFDSDLFKGMRNSHEVKLPRGEWQVFSLASAMSEELAAEIIPHETYSGIKMYSNYLTAGGNEKTNKALDALVSLMKTNEMYLKNPMGQNPNRNQYSNTNQGDFLYKFSVNEWKSYQDKLGEWLILKQVK